jgi:hypothetical protein
MVAHILANQKKSSTIFAMREIQGIESHRDLGSQRFQA